MERRTFLKSGLAFAGAAAAAPVLIPRRAPAATVGRLDTLARRLKGRLVLPEDKEYGILSQPWNLHYADEQPSAVVVAASESDVAEAVRFARDEGLEFVARNGRHSFAGFSASRGLVIDVSALNAVTVDSAETARIGAGMTNLSMYEALWPHRMTVPAGTCPTVGVTGLALGGGLGRLSGLHGYTSDNLTGLRMVTADGRAITADQGENPDLFWASRGGGGGNFGVVTELSFRLRPVDMPFTTIDLTFPWAAALKVMRAWQQWIGELPREGHSDIQFVTGAPGSGPTVTVEVDYAGAPERGKALADDLIAAAGTDPVDRDDVVGPFLSAERDWECAALRADECAIEGLSPNGKLQRSGFVAGSDFVFAPWPDEGILLLIDAIEKRQADRLLTPEALDPAIHVGKALIEVCGGAMDDIAPDATAFAHRGAIYLTQYQGRWAAGADPSVATANVAWMRAMYDSVARYRSGASYVNYADRGLADWGRAYYGANLERLMQIKAKVDPDNVFRFPQSIPPV